MLRSMRLSTRLGLCVFAFLVPIGYLLFLLVSAQNADIRFVSVEASGAAHTSFAFFVGVTVLLAVRECVDVGVPVFVRDAVFVLVRVLRRGRG